MTDVDAQAAETNIGDLRQQSDLKYQSRSGLRYFLRRFAGETPLNVLALGIITVFIFLSIFGRLLAPYDPIVPDIANKLAPPSAAHWLGTDELGRDILSRVLTGTRISLGIATMILSIAITAGVLIGAVAGYVGGWVDEVLMRITDIFLAFPALILAMGIAASLGRDLKNVIIALTLVYWPWYARLIRGQVLMIRERDFVEAAHAIGMRPSRVLLRHILPNTMAPIIVQATVDVGYAVLATAGLSFIGLGAQPPSPEWGTMIAGARAYFRVAWWYMTFPGIALTLTVIGFNLLGDGLRDYFDPRTRLR
ncbi:MAG TPA: ABC transporter permease [Thermomicrobiales bacterium]|jgi:peptide/nickel transport system permease protein|nr:D,D-dipeptide ABC transporter permease [Chloroflexota bacterium]HQX63481.1 ABC transporter permease [Thermomicrobiales bacterium]HQZ89073.1 ABC transporter permease [Thermomicrobiales bacterium]